MPRLIKTKIKTKRVNRRGNPLSLQNDMILTLILIAITVQIVMVSIIVANTVFDRVRVIVLSNVRVIV